MPSVLPIVATDGLEALVAFYRDRLGFAVTFEMDGPDGELHTVTLELEGTQIMFTEARFGWVAPRALDPTGLILSFEVADVDAHHAAVTVHAEVEITDPLSDEFWGDRLYSVLDPRGLKLTFLTHTGRTVAPPDGYDVRMREQLSSRP